MGSWVFLIRNEEKNPRGTSMSYVEFLLTIETETSFPPRGNLLGRQAFQGQWLGMGRGWQKGWEGYRGYRVRRVCWRKRRLRARRGTHIQELLFLQASEADFLHQSHWLMGLHLPAYLQGETRDEAA